MKPTKTLKLKTIVALAILIRLLVMPFFFHPDLKTQYFHFQFLSQGVTNIYQYVYNHKSTLGNTDTFNYLPLTYFSFGSYYHLINFLHLPHLSSWLNDWGTYQNSYPNLPFYLLFLKLPYLFFDLLTGYFLFKIYKNKNIFLLWLFNPISIYLVYILGNFDILPVLLTVIAYYFLIKKNALSFVVLGFAVALKLYPLMLLPFFLLHRPHKLQTILTNIFLALLPVIITLIPFAYNSTFWTSFFSSGLTQKLIEIRLLNVHLFPVLYLILLYHYFKQQKFGISILYLFISFVTLINFHPQWLLWFLPFILPLYIQNKKIHLGLIILSILLFIYISLFNDQYLFWGHLTPIDPNFPNLISPHQIIFHFIGDNVHLAHSFLHLVFPLIYLCLIRPNESSK